jgi:hypothetical protein
MLARRLLRRCHLRQRRIYVSYWLAPPTRAVICVSDGRLRRQHVSLAFSNVRWIHQPGRVRAASVQLLLPSTLESNPVGAVPTATVSIPDMTVSLDTTDGSMVLNGSLFVQGTGVSALDGQLVTVSVTRTPIGGGNFC